MRDRYLAFARSLSAGLTLDNKAAALKLAQLPEQVRGYGHVKLAAMNQTDAAWEGLMCGVCVAGYGVIS